MIKTYFKVLGSIVALVFFVIGFVWATNWIAETMLTAFRFTELQVASMFGVVVVLIMAFSITLLIENQDDNYEN